MATELSIEKIKQYYEGIGITSNSAKAAVIAFFTQKFSNGKFTRKDLEKQGFLDEFYDYMYQEVSFSSREPLSRLLELLKEQLTA